MACQGDYNFTGWLPVLFGIVDIILTLVGLIPEPVPIAGQVAIVTDGLTVALNLLLDDPIATVLSVLSLVPFAGIFSGVLKIIYRVVLIIDYFVNISLLKIAAAVGTLACIGFAYYFIYVL